MLGGAKKHSVSRAVAKLEALVPEGSPWLLGSLTAADPIAFGVLYPLLEAKGNPLAST